MKDFLDEQMFLCIKIFFKDCGNRYRCQTGFWSGTCNLREDHKVLGLYHSLTNGSDLCLFLVNINKKAIMWRSYVSSSIKWSHFIDNTVVTHHKLWERLANLGWDLYPAGISPCRCAQDCIVIGSPNNTTHHSWGSNIRPPTCSCILCHVQMHPQILMVPPWFAALTTATFPGKSVSSLHDKFDAWSYPWPPGFVMGGGGWAVI